MIEQEIARIMPPIGPQDRLLAQMRPHLLEENENHRRQHQVEDEPVEADITGRGIAWPDLYRGAAAPQRKQGQRDADRTHHFVAIEDEGEEAERRREDHAAAE